MHPAGGGVPPENRKHMHKVLEVRSKKTGYAQGRPENAEGHVRQAFEGAAGVHVRQAQQSTYRQSKKIVEPEKRPANKNLHIGFSSDTEAAGGVYDFHPSKQGEKARSAPKRRTQVGDIIYGSTHTESPAEHFGTHYDGAAGRAAGHWADARYASTTQWS